MLSIGELNADQVRTYHLAAVARSPLDYYAGRGEAVGVWLGAGSARLGLEGEVDPDQLGRLLTGDDPHTGETLVTTKRRRSRAAFDLTFSAPKGVSLLGLLGDDATAAAVCAAHDRAVADALGYVERRALAVRRGHDGLDQLRASGLVAAGFVHRSSRSGDPQLHTHVVVANVAEGSDGRWSAPDARLFYRHARTAGFLYQASLRAELTRTLGLRWAPVRRGMAEPAGLSVTQLREFSTRRTRIVAELARRDRSGATAARLVTLDTRTSKADTPPVDIGAWRQRAERVGLSAERLAQLSGPSRPAGFTRAQASLCLDTLVGPDGLCAHAATFDRAAPLRAIAEAAADGASVAEVEALADAVLAHRAVAALAPDPDPRVGDDLDRFSTAELLATEARLLQRGIEGQDRGVAQVGEAVVDEVLGAATELSHEQRQMVRRITTSGDGIELVIGRAGTGKTTAMAAAAKAWTDSGHRVVGAALAARAAAELQRGAGVAAMTIARLELDLATPGQALAPNTVLIVDEAGLVGTRTLERLSALAQASGAKLVLVGDPRQLPEIDAGGSFAALAAALNPAELTLSRRQEQAWERAALDDLRHGDVYAAVEAFDAHDRLHAFADADATRAAMVADWMAARSTAPEPMLSERRSEVELLNALARRHLSEAGLIGDVELVVGQRSFAVGDLVIPQLNDHRAGLRNGEIYTVADLDAEGLDVVDREGECHRVALNYMEAGHLTHGYATTVYKGQGMTVDNAFVATTDTTRREQAYVATSRARSATHIYTTARENPRDDIAHAPEPRAEMTPVQQVGQAWARSGAQRLALPASAPDAVDDATIAAFAADKALFVSHLGPRPAPGPDRRHWDRAAAVVDAYRTRWDVTDTDTLLGPVPDRRDRVAQRLQRDHAARLCEQARRRMSRERSAGLGR